MLPTLHGEPHLNNVLYVEGEHDLKSEFTSNNREQNKSFYELDMKGAGKTHTNVSVVSPEAGDVVRAENDVKRLAEIKENYPNISPQMLKALGAGQKKRTSKSTNNSNKSQKSTKSTSKSKKSSKGSKGNKSTKNKNIKKNKNNSKKKKNSTGQTKRKQSHKNKKQSSKGKK